jgi:hypothetical protein
MSEPTSPDGDLLPGESPEPKHDNVNGQRAFETLRQFLEEDGWFPQQIDDRPIYRVAFSGKNGELRCYAQIRIELEQMLFYAVAPVKAAEEVRSDVAEYLTRANYGLRIGNFELDYHDGEVRYKASLDFESETLTYNFIRNAIYPAVQTMDRYLKGLLSVMFGGRTPVEAIQEVEGEVEDN